MVKRVHPGLAILAASVPMFMVSLNNLVVTNALPAIRKDFTADVANLQWVVNAYVLAFASLLLTGAALGDRYGRRTVFVLGIVVFSAGSVACALSDSMGMLIAARVLQGIGAAAVQPLSLTLLAAAVPEHKRSAALGLWGGVNGLGVALGPVVGGAVTEGLAWQWIFWINLPVGVIAVPLVLWAIRNSKGKDRELDIPGMLLVTGAITLTVWAIVRAEDDGFGSPKNLASFLAALALLVLFVLWEQKAKNPLLPLRFYRIRAFVMSNFVSLAMFFGVFGSIFFLAQYLQGPLGFSPFGAGLRTLPWTAMPMVVAPLAGLFTDRLGGGRLMTLGLALQGVGLAWIASIATFDLDYVKVVPPLVIAGIGMGLVFGPTSSVVLGSVLPHEHGKASGANNTVREVGGALGVAVLTTVFAHYQTEVSIRSQADAAKAFVHGMVPAIWVGVGVVGLGVVAGLFIPRHLTATAMAKPKIQPVTTDRIVQGDIFGRHRVPRRAFTSVRLTVVVVGLLITSTAAAGAIVLVRGSGTLFTSQSTSLGSTTTSQLVIPSPSLTPSPAPPKPTRPPSSTVPVPPPPPTTTTTTPPPTTTKPPPSALDQARDEMLVLINRERDKVGCRPVVEDGRLDEAAQLHSLDMAARKYFSHVTPDGITPKDRELKAGYPHPGAESLAQGKSSPSEVVAAWMRSDSNRAAILDCTYVAAGFGVTDDHTLWTQVLGG